jgi:predicted ATPase
VAVHRVNKFVAVHRVNEFVAVHRVNEFVLVQILHGDEMAPTEIEVAMGRRLAVPRAAGGACCFTFAELCGTNVGASDYIALVSSFHTIAIQDVPAFDARTRGDAYRFVKLVDVMYEHRAKVRTRCACVFLAAVVFRTWRAAA